MSNPVLRQLYDAYSFQMIPVMGQVIAGDWNSYQYLVESIRVFPDQEAFKGMIEDAGFRMVMMNVIAEWCMSSQNIIVVVVQLFGQDTAVVDKPPMR